MSSKNPFRAHITQSSETAEGSHPNRPESPPLPPLPPDSSLSPPSDYSSNEPSSAGILHSSAGPDSASPVPPPPSNSTPGPPAIEDRIDDDLPPAYTPAADISMGEETLEVGPRRPFQQPPPRPGPSSYAPSSSRPHFLQPSGQPVQSWPTGSGPQNPAPWQTQQQYQRHGRGGGLIGSLLREVVDVVSGAHDERMITQRANAAAYAAPYPNTGSYAPPSGPPPQGQRAPPARPQSTPPRSPSAIPDDGSPTRTPVPGHPLLRDGNLLVYPKDHLCVKCKNTGYKNYDPSNPCRKCWEKYGKPYTGVLTYTPWAPSGNDPRMQRALPRFVPPHLAPANPGSYPGHHSHRAPFPPPPQHPQNPQHSRSASHPRAVPPSQTGASYYVVNPLISWDSTPPVPHAIPVSPGDPRLGGRLCMRCGGEGVKTVLLFDLTTCEACGGTGRVWR